MGSIMFGYGGANAFPNIQNNMQDRTKFKKCVLIAFAILLFIYFPVGFMGYYEFGDNINENILLQVHGICVTITKFLFPFQ